jgi:hypothetical protein
MLPHSGRKYISIVAFIAQGDKGWPKGEIMGRAVLVPDGH